MHWIFKCLILFSGICLAIIAGKVSFYFLSDTWQLCISTWLWSWRTWSLYKFLNIFLQASIGIALFIMANWTYRQKRDSEFIVNYVVSQDGCKTEWDEYTRKNSFAASLFGAGTKSRMPFIAKIYIHNKKNKTEVIERIFLEISRKIIIPIATYENKPLIVEKFSHVTESLKPVSYYHAENDCQNPFIVEDSKDGYDLLYNKKNRIIIQTDERLVFVKPNIEHKNPKFKKYTNFKLMRKHWIGGTILSQDITNIIAIPLEGRLPNEEFITYSSIPHFKMATEELDKAKEFGLQFISVENQEWRANYYFINEEGELFFSPVSPSWNKNFMEEYKSFLKNQGGCKDINKNAHGLVKYWENKGIHTGIKGKKGIGYGKQNPPQTLSSILTEKTKRQRFLSSLKKTLSSIGKLARCIKFFSFRRSSKEN